MFTKLMDGIKAAILSKYVASFVRHGMTSLGGLLTGVGLEGAVVSDFVNSGTQVVVGLSVVGIGWVFSLADKKKNQAK